MLISWLGFFVSIVVLLLVSRRNLGIALIVAGITLGLFTMPFSNIWVKVLLTLKSPSVILLAIAMGIIPIIGGVLSVSGGLDDMVNNLRIGKKAFLGFAPALVGMLPMPGGALFSAPLVEKGGKGVRGGTKVALNVWFRHILFLVYPLTPILIVPAKIAGLSVYEVIPYLFPLFLFSVFLGYFFFLRKIEGALEYDKRFSLKALSKPLSVILLAPLLDFSLQKLFNFRITEIATLLAVSSSLVLALIFSKFKNIGASPIRKEFSNGVNVAKVIKEMKVWNFVLIIIGMFLFLNIFKASGIGELIASLSLSKVLLCVVVGFILGLATGRVQLPASIVIPIFLTTFGVSSMAIITFVLTYFSIFLGYLISPVHPCVSVSLEYFNVRLSGFFATIGLPAFIAFTITLILALFFIY